jgi:hypothetical protein
MPNNANSAIFGTLKNMIKHFSGHECISLKKHTFVSDFLSVFNVYNCYTRKGSVYDNLPKVGQHFVHERNVPGSPSHEHCLPLLFIKKKQ